MKRKEQGIINREKKKGDNGNFPIQLYKGRLKGKQEGEELPGETPIKTRDSSSGNA